MISGLGFMVSVGCRLSDMGFRLYGTGSRV